MCEAVWSKCGSHQKLKSHQIRTTIFSENFLKIKKIIMEIIFVNVQTPLPPVQWSTNYYQEIYFFYIVIKFYIFRYLHFLNFILVSSSQVTLYFINCLLIT